LRKFRNLRVMDRCIWSCLLGILLLTALLSSGEQGKTAASRSFHCLIDIETEPVDDYMTFEGSQLVPIIKATVSYRMADGQTPAESASSSKYEELWYRGGDPIGCESSEKLGTRELSLTQIRISSKSAHPSQAEIAAQANALVRIYLDAYLRFALLTSVVVPDELFSSILNSLAKENFMAGQYVYGSSIDPSIYLPLESQSGKQTASLHYNTAR
jgi:hypothetical protein